MYQEHLQKCKIHKLQSIDMYRPSERPDRTRALLCCVGPIRVLVAGDKMGDSLHQAVSFDIWMLRVQKVKCTRG